MSNTVIPFIFILISSTSLTGKYFSCIIIDVKKYYSNNRNTLCNFFIFLEYKKFHYHNKHNWLINKTYCNFIDHLYYKRRVVIMYKDITIFL